jgi:hypothetical protein
MLTDSTLRNLKPGPTAYKVSDRDGMYVLVTTAGCVSFRYDYRLKGRRETFVIGRYNARGQGLSLGTAREKCMEARNAVARGESPAQAKQSSKVRISTAQTFFDHAEDFN